MTEIKGLYGTMGRDANAYLLDIRASIAQDLIKTYGIIAATDNGEDSAGRHKFRLQSPEETVQRSCDIADLLVNEFEARGWVKIFSPEESITVTEESLALRAVAEAKAFDVKYESRKAK